jgi:hypothetical protein
MFPAHKTGVMIEKGAGLSIGIGGNVADLGRVGKSGSTLPLRDLAAQIDVVAVTRRGGFLSALFERATDLTPLNRAEAAM